MSLSKHILSYNLPQERRLCFSQTAMRYTVWRENRDFCFPIWFSDYFREIDQCNLTLVSSRESDLPQSAISNQRFIKNSNILHQFLPKSNDLSQCYLLSYFSSVHLIVQLHLVCYQLSFCFLFSFLFLFISQEKYLKSP